MKKQTKIIKLSGFSLILVTVISVTFFVFNFVAAQNWQGPLLPPPDGNTPGVIFNAPTINPVDAQVANINLSDSDPGTGKGNIIADAIIAGTFFVDSIEAGEICFDTDSGPDCQTVWPGGGGGDFWADADNGNIKSTNSGNVGIGTASPIYQLDVLADGSKRALNVKLNNGGSGTTYAGVFENTTASGFLATSIGVEGIGDTEGVRGVGGSKGVGGIAPTGIGGWGIPASTGARAIGVNGFVNAVNSFGGYFSTAGTGEGLFASSICLGTETNCISVWPSGGVNSFWKDVGSGNIQSLNSGNVGIGTADPLSELHILGDQRATLVDPVTFRIENKANDYFANLSLISGDIRAGIGLSAQNRIDGLLGGLAGDLWIANQTGGDITFIAGGQQRFTIRNDGQLCFGSDTGDCASSWEGGNLWLHSDDPANKFIYYNLSQQENKSSVRISDGEASLGDNNPISQLAVHSWRVYDDGNSSNAAYIKLRSVTAQSRFDEHNDIVWGDFTDTKLNFVYSDFDSNIDDKIVMTLLPNGNVGIGTADPLKKLHIRGYQPASTNNGLSIVVENTANDYIASLDLISGKDNLKANGGIGLSALDSSQNPGDLFIINNTVGGDLNFFTKNLFGLGVHGFTVTSDGKLCFGSSGFGDCISDWSQAGLWTPSGNDIYYDVGAVCIGDSTNCDENVPFKATFEVVVDRPASGVAGGGTDPKPDTSATMIIKNTADDYYASYRLESGDASGGFGISASKRTLGPLGGVPSDLWLINHTPGGNIDFVTSNHQLRFTITDDGRLCFGSDTGDCISSWSQAGGGAPDIVWTLFDCGSAVSECEVKQSFPLGLPTATASKGVSPGGEFDVAVQMVCPAGYSVLSGGMDCGSLQMAISKPIFTQVWLAACAFPLGSDYTFEPTINCIKFN